MKTTLDERLRGGLTKPCGKAARAICAALTVLGFALVMATRTLALGHSAATAAALCVPLAMMLLFAMRIVKENGQGVLDALLLCALCAPLMPNLPISSNRMTAAQPIASRLSTFIGMTVNEKIASM